MRGRIQHLNLNFQEEKDRDLLLLLLIKLVLGNKQHLCYLHGLNLVYSSTCFLARNLRNQEPWIIKGECCSPHGKAQGNLGLLPRSLSKFGLTPEARPGESTIAITV